MAVVTNCFLFVFFGCLGGVVVTAYYVPCFDKLPDCYKWEEAMCWFGKHNQWGYDYCRKTCGVCDRKPQIPTFPPGDQYRKCYLKSGRTFSVGEMWKGEEGQDCKCYLDNEKVCWGSARCIYY